MTDNVKNRPILIIDDEKHAILSLKLTLKTAFSIKNIVGCEDVFKADDFLKENEPLLVLLDIGMPGITGDKFLNVIKERYPAVPVIMVTAEVELETAIGCMKSGAFDYISKPVNKERLLSSVRKAIDFRTKELEVEALRSTISNPLSEVPEEFSHIVTSDPKMLSNFRYLQSVTKSNAPILISGETGTGKELFAEGIHNVFGAKTPFVCCNVAGLDDQLFSDTLFGHVKGAFTGANGDRKGLVESANGGVLFLDEIGDLSTASQIKLLRLLQEQEYTPLGADKPKKCNVKIILATHINLKEKMNGGEFRSDLFYRLNTHTVHLPPLRERHNDLQLLLIHFIESACKNFSKPQAECDPAVVALLKSYSFPGNVRELKAMVDDVVARHEKGKITQDQFVDKIPTAKNSNATNLPSCETQDWSDSLKYWETLPTFDIAKNLLVREAMRRSSQNQSVAAKLIGISRQALGQWIRRHNEEEK